MSWEREPLFIKSRVFFEKAFNEDRESLFFGLFCALGLELLIRSAIANVSPTLLADPDREQQNLLHALSMGSVKHQKKSIATSQVVQLCKQLIQAFTEKQSKTVSAIISRRNEEVHSGSASFEEYPTQQWIGGFYDACKILAEFQGENLESLFGEEVEKEANLILQEIAEEVFGKVKSLIAAHSKVFENKEEQEQKRLKLAAEEKSDMLAYRRHHRVDCPSCNCKATVTGETYGKELVESKPTEIIVRQSIIPTRFNCTACELKLAGYNYLNVAGVANHYTRKTVYSPEEYYDMINPEDHESIEAKYIENNPPDYYEWDNE